MRSTGEVMGIDQDFGWAFAKSQAAAGLSLPHGGTVILSVKAGDKPGTVNVAQRLQALGFQLQATRGTAAYLLKHGLDMKPINKVKEGRPHIVDHIKNRQAQLVVNTVAPLPHRTIRCLFDGRPCNRTSPISQRFRHSGGGDRH